MKAAFIHGKKLLNNGQLNQEFVNRLEKGRELLDSGKVDQIIISGGKTRSRFPAECEEGEKYLFSKGVLKNQTQKIHQVYSTYDEVLALRKLLATNKNIKQVFVITSTIPMLRTRILYKKFFKIKINPEFVASKSHDYLYYLLAEPAALLFAIIYTPKLLYLQKILNWFRIEFRNAGATRG